MIAALLDAYEITGHTAIYFDRALELMEITVRRFWDERGGRILRHRQDLADRHGSLTTAQAVPGFTHAGGECGGASRCSTAWRCSRTARISAKGGSHAGAVCLQGGQYGLFAATYGLALLASPARRRWTWWWWGARTMSALRSSSARCLRNAARRQARLRLDPPRCQGRRPARRPCRHAAEFAL